MRLRSLTLNGFKSFADKTTIDFVNGITGIVGPNGSGKSNITEAIRWVMGEQSAKSLRGTHMTDIIFAGTALRAPLNRADVTIRFDNSDHYLKNASEQLEITRSFYRDGTSEFKINQRSCRLKDITDLFMDSGLGRDSFSIISQGRVEAIFNSKPEERRSIIEAAAGVLKYKIKKKQAQKELTQTEDNLNRVLDIVHELKEQLVPLQRQSSVAKDYLSQKKQYDNFYQQLLVKEITALVTKQHAAQQQAQQLTASLQAIESRLHTAQQQLTTKHNEQQKITTSLDQHNQQLLATTKQLQVVKSAEQVANERQNNQQSNLTELTNQITTFTAQVKQIKQQLTNALAQQQQQQQLVKKFKSQITTLTKQAGTSKVALNDKLTTLQDKYVDLLQQQTSNHNDLHYAEKQLQQTKQLDQQHQDQVQKLQQQINNSQTKTTTLDTQQQQLYDQLQQQQQQLQQLQQQQQQLQQQYDQAQKAWYQALNIFQQVKTRKNTLQEAATDHTGFYQGVKAVLDYQKQNHGIKGAIAELIQVALQYQTAIETALGSQLQFVVTDTAQTAQQVITYLKQHHLGRATFLPMTVMKSRLLPTSILDSLQQYAGFIDIAANLVTYDKRFQNIINYLLGNTIVVDNLTTANKIAKVMQYRYRIVTSDGDLINPGGTMTGGQVNRHSNLLSRQSELQELAKQVTQMQVKLDDQQDNITILKTDYQKVTNQIDHVKKQVSELTNSYQLVHEDWQKSNLQLKQWQQQLTAMQFVNQKDNDEQQSLITEIAKLQQTATSLVAQLKQTDNAITKTKLALTSYSERQQQISTQLTNLQQQQAAVQATLQATNQQIDLLKQNQQQVQQQIDHLQQRQQQITNGQHEDQQQRQQRQQQLQQLQRKIIQLQQKVKVEITQQNTLQQQINALTMHKDQDYQLQKQTFAEQEQVAITLSKLKTKLDQHLLTLNEQYHLSFEAAQQQFTSTLTIMQLQQKIKLLKQSINELGNVNIDAIAEYQRVKTRYDFLTQQQSDLQAAQQQLLTTMSEMDQTVIKEFTQTFNEIAQAFTKIFPIMFGGGQARLELTNPDDMLTTGIEIIVQPPGKKLQHLTLLSGGERALTAITLLFAILQVRPVPFCILDEVEASLDDVNVARFGSFLQHYESDTQFIVITHRKGTMLAADRLYGVTMEESGVSKVVAIDLKDKEK